MAWYAQRAGLPDAHSMWADAGSDKARVFAHMGMVEVPAPGSAEQDTEPAPDTATVEPAEVEATES